MDNAPKTTKPYKLAPRLAAIFGLGFSSGLPRLLIYSTLSFWLIDIGLKIEAIGLFAAVSIPYNLKFLWAPLLDAIRVPFLAHWLGRRRSWILVFQLLLAAGIVAIALSNPSQTPLLAALAALLVAIFSASQDVVIDAYRVELLDNEDQGAGAAAVVYGYRVGMLVAGAGALYIAHGVDSWSLTYLVMAAIMFASTGITLIVPKTEDSHGRPSWNPQDALLGPFKDFLTRAHWPWILAFVLLFKIGDALAGTMINPFLLSLDYTKVEIADVGKVFGLIATLVGVGIGGLLVKKLGVIVALWIGGFAQMFSNLMFVVQAVWGHDIWMLVALIGTENLTGGIGTAAFVAYLSMLCARQYTATQYALLTALSSVLQTLISSTSGFGVALWGWVGYFAMTTVVAIPGLCVLAVLQHRLGQSQSEDETS